MASSLSAFKVIIVDGGIAELTLALCLERHGIQYLLLESRKTSSSQSGSSLGIFPNGPNGRKTQYQLDVLKDLPAEYPTKASYVWTGDGKVLLHGGFLQMSNER
jgi:2-polyprenyl-6-methoxyphenol hydroxylase-like FAD-dependent oxidoreductase